VIDIASNYFYYLNESPAQIQIALGDAAWCWSANARSNSTCWP